MTTFLLATSVCLLVVAAVQATRFVLRYRRRTWRRTPAGRHLMSMTATLAVILWATLGLAIIPMPIWAALLVQVVLFGALTWELIARNMLLTRSQREVPVEQIPLSRAVAALRLLRIGLHRRAFEHQSRGHAEAAQAVWAFVEEIDDLLSRLTKRAPRRH